MPRLMLLLGLLLLLLPLPALAQDIPGVEIFGGFSFSTMQFRLSSGVVLCFGKI